MLPLLLLPQPQLRLLLLLLLPLLLLLLPPSLHPLLPRLLPLLRTLQPKQRALARKVESRVVLEAVSLSLLERVPQLLLPSNPLLRRVSLPLESKRSASEPRSLASLKLRVLNPGKPPLRELQPQLLRDKSHNSSNNNSAANETPTRKVIVSVVDAVDAVEDAEVVVDVAEHARANLDQMVKLPLL